HKVRWRIAAEIRLVFSSNYTGVLDIKTVISFRAFPFGFELQGGGAIAEDLLIQLVAENKHQIVQEILIFFVFPGRSHDLQPSVIIADAEVITVAELVQELLILFPGDFVKRQPSAGRQVSDGFKILCGLDAHQARPRSDEGLSEKMGTVTLFPANPSQIATIFWEIR